MLQVNSFMTMKCSLRGTRTTGKMWYTFCRYLRHGYLYNQFLHPSHLPRHAKSHLFRTNRLPLFQGRASHFHFPPLFQGSANLPCTKPFPLRLCNAFNSPLGVSLIPPRSLLVCLQGL